MNVNLGDKIRELRRRDGRTQEHLADALGISSQAVSRWESGGGYPDIEALPAIANYFGVSIDELFGYDNDREERIRALLAEVDDKFLRHLQLHEMLPRLREAAAEFPTCEPIRLRLARAIYQSAGLYVYKPGEDIPSEAELLESTASMKSEAVNLLETLYADTRDGEIRRKAAEQLVYIYGYGGNTARALEIAEQFEPLETCREQMLIATSQGEEKERLIGGVLLRLAGWVSSLIPRQLILRPSNFEGEGDSLLAIQKVLGAIDFLKLICDDDNFGYQHANLGDLYEWLSHLYWRRGDKDAAFDCLDKALHHITEFVKLGRTGEHRYTAPLCDLVTENTDTWDAMDAALDALPGGWPMWTSPPYADALGEISQDPRWEEWLARWRATRDEVKAQKSPK
ncbi:MAG: helix-turn-helix domain-containing protein [Oscillospiraceae bacterium]|jgi:transcriptional regulator with XRE-family HTH domain|nr:helix-turn-helix domain-containing protein [Oscillospiraceae bacterium]